MNPFEPAFSGLQDVAPPQSQQAQGGISVYEGPPDPAQQARLDRDEAEGASNLRLAWERHDALRRDADLALQRYNAGQMTAEQAAAAIQRYNTFRAANKAMLEPRLVNQGNPIWRFFFGR